MHIARTPKSPLRAKPKVMLALWLTLVFVERTEGARLAPTSRFAFHLECESNEVFVVQQSTNLVSWRYYTRSSTGGVSRMILPSYPISVEHRVFYRALKVEQRMFPGAIVARHGVRLHEFDVRLDSFDSANPLYSTGGRYDIAKARDRGNVISIDTVTNTIEVGDSRIYGRVVTGPSGTVAMGPSGVVGDAAWQAGGNFGIQPGHSTDEAYVELPSVILPPGSEAWPVPPTNNSSGYMVFSTPGDYRITNLSGKILVLANTRLRVDETINLVGANLIRLTNNATLTIYMNGTTASLRGQGIVNSYAATNFVYIGTSPNSSLRLGGNGETTALIYAPYTDVTLEGGGNSTQEFSGAIVANSVRLTSDYNFHFDEDLLRYTTVW